MTKKKIKSTTNIKLTYNSHKELLSLVYKNLLKLNKDKDTKPTEKKTKNMKS